MSFQTLREKNELRNKPYTRQEIEMIDLKKGISDVEQRIRIKNALHEYGRLIEVEKKYLQQNTSSLSQRLHFLAELVSDIEDLS